MHFQALNINTCLCTCLPSKLWVLEKNYIVSKQWHRDVLCQTSMLSLCQKLKICSSARADQYPWWRLVLEISDMSPVVYNKLLEFLVDVWKVWILVHIGDTKWVILGTIWVACWEVFANKWRLKFLCKSIAKALGKILGSGGCVCRDVAFGAASISAVFPSVWLKIRLTCPRVVASWVLARSDRLRQVFTWCLSIGVSSFSCYSNRV